jgi:hypothetical protein
VDGVQQLREALGLVGRSRAFPRALRRRMRGHLREGRGLPEARGGTTSTQAGEGPDNGADHCSSKCSEHPGVVVPPLSLQVGPAVADREPSPERSGVSLFCPTRLGRYTPVQTNRLR